MIGAARRRADAAAVPQPSRPRNVPTASISWPPCRAGAATRTTRERAAVGAARRIARRCGADAAGVEPALHAALHPAAIVRARDDFLPGVATLVEGDGA